MPRAVSGFTLIETLVAIAVLTLAVAGPLFTAERTIVAAQTAADQLTASYLAQEGVEYVRAMRDSAYLAAYQSDASTATLVSWDSFLTNATVGADAVALCKSPSVCSLDPLAHTMGEGSGYALAPCAGGVCQPLYLTNCVQGTSGLSCTAPNEYTQASSGMVSVFARSVQVVPVTGANAQYDANGNPLDAEVLSTVSWSFHGTPYKVQLADHLTPWQ